MDEDRYPVGADVAETEFARFLDAMDIEESEVGEKSREMFDSAKEVVLKSMRRGHLTIDEEGQPQLKPQKTKRDAPITFYEPTGAVLMELDKFKDGQDIGRLVAMLAKMTNENVVVFKNMKDRDFRVAQAVLEVFLGAR